MPYCVAYGCFNGTNKKKSEKISFHKFPCDEALRDKWIAAVRRINWEPTIYSTLCSTHFKDEDFDKSSPFVIRLRANVVPTLFKSQVEDEAQPNTTQRKSAAHDDVPKKRRKIGKTLAQTAVASTSRLQDPLAMEDGLEQNRIMDEENAFEDDIQHSDNSTSLSRIDFVDVKREDIDVIDIKEEPIRFDESTDIDLPAYISQGELHIKEEKKDQCEQFGEFVSVSLEQLPEDQATLAQNDIENVLMKFKMLAANTLTH